jgi:hypothetical protein
VLLGMVTLAWVKESGGSRRGGAESPPTVGS